jgi:hypothetical protein
MKKEDLKKKQLTEEFILHQAEAVSYLIKALTALFSLSLLIGTNDADKSVEGFLDIIKSEVEDTAGYRSAKIQEREAGN